MIFFFNFDYILTFQIFDRPVVWVFSFTQVIIYFILENVSMSKFILQRRVHGTKEAC